MTQKDLLRKVTELMKDGKYKEAQEVLKQIESTRKEERKAKRFPSINNPETLF